MAQKTVQEFEAALKSHGHKAYGKMLAHAQAAKDARAKKQADQSGQHGISEENRHRLNAAHDREIDEHDQHAEAWGRRSDAAEAGFLLHGREEAGDGAYMREHQHLVSHAQEYGRLIHRPLKQLEDEVCPCEDGDGGE